MFAFILALAFHALTGHGSVTTYDNPGQRGVIVQIDATHCVGYESQGEVGFFGNTLGLKGGECS